MLLIEAFADLLEHLDRGALPGLLDEDLQSKVYISLVQACLHILLEQQDDGSWNQLPEQTCYAMLAISFARKLCLFDDIHVELQSSIERGAAFLEACSFRSADLNWTSKTAYNVVFVAKAYKLAALKVAHSPGNYKRVGRNLGFNLPSPKMGRYIGLVRRTPLFSEIPEWQMRASLLESALFVPLLRKERLLVYDRDDMPVTEDTYLDILPFTWVSCNNRRRTFASSSFVYDMIKLSLYGYQTDEFMEAVAAPVYSDVAELHRLIDKTVDRVTGKHDITSDGLADLTPAKVTKPLARFVEYVWNHETITKASIGDRLNLRAEMSAFLHAHTTQVADNARLKAQAPDTTVLASADTSFFQWVRTTGANHVACAYSLTFAFCLMSASLCSGADVFPTVTEKYLAAALTRHLATICRMYNDYGSIARDIAECNVNSVHFSEFSQCLDTHDDMLPAKKRALMDIADYGQSCLTLTTQALEHETLRSLGQNGESHLGSRKMSILKFYCDVTDLYNQLYFIKDLSSSMKHTEKSQDGPHA